MKSIKYNTILLFCLFTIFLFSCNNKEEPKLDSVIEENSQIRISLSYSVEGEEKPLEHTDLDLGLFDSNGNLVQESTNFGEEEIFLKSSASDKTYLVKLRRFEKNGDIDVDFIAFVTNSNGGENKEFSGTFSSVDEESNFSWDKGAVKTVIKIEKSGNEFNVVDP